MPTDLDDLAQALTALGCPEVNSRLMAEQLDRRAHQLAETTGRSFDEAMSHLLRLMAGGWAAREARHGPERPLT